MADTMMFPGTWEEYEKVYGLTDTEQIYTNGSRLIPSFRAKQWLDHSQSKLIEELECVAEDMRAMGDSDKASGVETVLWLLEEKKNSTEKTKPVDDRQITFEDLGE